MTMDADTRQIIAFYIGDRSKLREEEENNLPQMKKLFFSYVWLNLTRPECFRDKENLVKHMRKRTIQTGRLFFSSSLSAKKLWKLIPETY